jgi:hypothetical protein
MSQRVWGLGLFAALIALVSLFACRQLVGITDNPPEDLVTSTAQGVAAASFLTTNARQRRLAQAIGLACPAL